MDELTNNLEILLSDIQNAQQQLNLGAMRGRASELENEIRKPQFWANDPNAVEKSQEQAHLTKRIEEWEQLENKAAEALELAKLDDSKLEADLKKQYQELQEVFEAKEFELKLSGEYDKNSAILSVHGGTGGTDAMDWAQILQRMYLRWAEKEDYKAEIVDESAGEEAGLKSTTLKISGEFAYGRLKGEHGVHRLVRQSPFNADNLRQTSFALVEVLPVIPGSEVMLEDKDLRVDTFRAGGHGGQSVNTTDSAVRVTHMPTGLNVSIQSERSQKQNKEVALSILKSKLLQLKKQQNKEKLEEIKGPTITEQWGQQIRNYVMHPYTLVKDTRTNEETSDITSVLDGGINKFIEAYLKKQIGPEE